MESARHAALVLLLARRIRLDHASAGLVVLADHVEYGTDRPWPIDGFFPDVLATDLLTGREFVGEAKTPTDLETDRSARQISAFVRHVALRGTGVFYLGVPWGHEARAALVLGGVARTLGPRANVEVVGLA